MDLGVFVSTFGLIFIAELGDKTQLTAMALATRYPWRKIFAGTALAFLVLNLGAVIVGKILFTLLPLFWIKVVSGLLFVFFGVTTLLARSEEGGGGSQQKRSARGPFITSFVMILLAELGDKTQLVTASLAAQYPSPLAVFTGSTLALWAVSLLGIFLGRQLLRFVPLVYVHRAAGVLFLLFGVIISYNAFTAS